MSEMIERVAKAKWARRQEVARAAGIQPLLADWDDELEGLREEVRAEARCAIEAMREPTVAMLSYETPDAMVHPGCFTCGGHLEGWRLMIDAALDTASQITPHKAGS
ncbi:hypothetical protein [Bradyrhizobium sp. LA2.1]|uniref:hypothetical protein n=1 Tax=Bradyrhizobium sp. LA2.1 TaxID=3156376 RepID=UPI003392F2A4